MKGGVGGILAIDQGTTTTKAYVLRPDGAFVAAGVRRHRRILPRPGWVEHDPHEILGHIRDLIGAAGDCARMGLANQGETVVAWDAHTKAPLGNAIVWQDERTAPEITALRAAGVEALTLARAGLPLDPYFSASKLRWLLDHAPGADICHRQGRLRLGTSDAFFLDSLAGAFATDVSTASRTSLMDLDRLAWDADLCAAFGVPMACLPEIRPSGGDFGAVAMPGGLGPRIVASLVDQQAALFGHGGRERGDIKITFGTGAFALGLTGGAPCRGDSGLIPTVAWRLGAEPAAYALDGGIFTAGAAIDWLRGIGLLDGLAALDRHDGRPVAESGLFFVPAQAGLGAPHWDRGARGAWLGLGLATSRADLCRAVLEGIGFRAAELVRALAVATGAEGRISVDGGMSRNLSFVQFLADALGRPVAVADEADITAFGVALLARTVADSFRDAGLPPQPRWRLVLPRDPLAEGLHEAFAAAVAKVRGRGAPGIRQGSAVARRGLGLKKEDGTDG